MKKSKNPRIRAKQDSISKAKEITRKKGKCEKCGKTTGQMHGSHILSVGAYPAMAAELNNILCLCAGCHNMSPNSWHKEPGENIRWLDEKWPGRLDNLYLQAQTQVEVDWFEKLKELNGLDSRKKEN